MLIYLTLIDGDDNKKRFEDVYINNRYVMFHVANEILKNEAESEDTVHAAFVRLAERFNHYETKSMDELCSLCIVITKHIAIDTLRKNRKISEADIDDIILFNENESLQPEDNILNDESEADAVSIMNELPETLRIVLELKYYQELDNKEIGKILHLKPKAVDQKLYRAKKKLKKVIEEREKEKRDCT